MRLAVLCTWGALAVVACSSSAKNTVTEADGGGATGGSAGTAGTAAKWPDSATTNCSDGTQSNVGCPSSGQDYYGQDGNFEINVPIYKVNGAELTDDVTSLVWRFGAASTSQADAATGCQAIGAEWRLPSFLELASLMDYGASSNAVPSVVNNGAAELWTATEFPVASAGWIFSTASGVPGAMDPASLTPSLCVTGPQIQGGLGAPSDGVVQDARTGLYWQTVAVTDRTWKEALLHCLKAEGGKMVTGWRLPTIKELVTIAEPEATIAIDTTVFDSTAAVWSSTPLVDDGSQAWTMKFNPLQVAPALGTATAALRCVHDPS